MATKFITVPIEIMHDKKLNQSQKFLLAEIHQLISLEKGCIAGNKHFSDLIGITRSNVSKNLNDLEKKKYIKTEVVIGTRNHTRIITLAETTSPPCQSSKTPLVKVANPPCQNDKSLKEHNNEESNMNKSIEINFNMLLGFLNKETGRQFRTINKSVQSKFKARLKDGYQKEDILNAIKNASKTQYHKDNGCQYLTPEFFSRASTLDKYGFATKKVEKAVEVKDAMKQGTFVNF